MVTSTNINSKMPYFPQVLEVYKSHDDDRKHVQWLNVCLQTLEGVQRNITLKLYLIKNEWLIFNSISHDVRRCILVFF